ncbi:MAG: SpoIIE family protein phosphatase [Flavobacteriaceae bacterium]
MSIWKFYIVFFVILSTPNSFSFGQEISNQTTSDDPANKIIENFDNSFLNRPQSVWSVLRSSKNNMLYFGTFDGIKEYDGKNVTDILIQGEIEGEIGVPFVRKLIDDQEGKVFAAGVGLLGTLEKDPYGNTFYQSIISQIPDSINPYQQVFWGALKQDSRLLFYTRERVFRWDNDHFDTVWKISDYKEGVDASGTIQTLIKANNRIFLRVWNQGVFELIDDQFVFLKGSELYKENRIEAAYELNQDEIAFFSSSNGVHLLDQQGSFTPSKNKVLNQWIIKNKIYNVDELNRFSNGNFPLISFEGGTLILDEHLNIIDLLDQNDGLLSNTITSLFIDSNDDLYLTSLLSACKVKMNNSITAFNESDGIKGLVQKIKKLDQSLYLSTTEDIFKIETNSNPLKNNQIKDLGIDDIPKDFTLFNDEIISVNNSSLSTIKNNQKKIISNDRLLLSAEQSLLDTRLLILAHPIEGIVFYKKEQGIRKLKSVTIEGTGIISIKELNPGTLYVEASEGEGSFLGFYNQNAEVTFERVLTPDNQLKIASQENQPSSFLNSTLSEWISEPQLTLFETGAGYFVFDEDLKLYRFASSWELEEVGLDLYPIFENNINFQRLLSSVNPITKNNWFLIEGGVMEVKFDTTGYEILNRIPFGSIDESELSGAFLSDVSNDRDLLWLGSKDARIIAWFPKTNTQNDENTILPIIKEISFNGNPIDLSQTQKNYSDSRSIRFNYAFPNFEKVENNLYRVRLAGQDDDWSPWSHSTESTYTNLSEARYDFQLQAMDTNGNVSELVSYSFSILPPWYRTYLAYFVYLLLGAFFIWIFGKFQAKRSLSKAENDRREKDLEEAKRIQESMLPKVFPKFEGYAITAGLITSTEVGGDYYDFFEEKDQSLYIICGDATGHGTAAGMMVSIIKSALNGIPFMPVNKILEKLNNIVKKINLGRLRMSLNIAKVTAHSNTIDFTAAAMPPSYHFISKTKECQEIMAIGLPLGGLANEKFDLMTIPFHKGDVLVMLSDGLPEAANENKELYDYPRIKELIEENHSKSPEELKRLFFDDLDQWLKGGIPEDDVTIVIVKKVA